MFSLIQLPYAPDALAPVISADTIGIHHGKHLQGYADKLNRLLPGSGLEDKSLEEIVVISNDVERSKALVNYAGQILNRNLYFTQFKPTAPELVEGPTGQLKEQIERQWRGIEAFQADFVAKGVSLFPL